LSPPGWIEKKLINCLLFYKALLFKRFFFLYNSINIREHVKYNLQISYWTYNLNKLMDNNFLCKVKLVSELCLIVIAITARHIIITCNIIINNNQNKFVFLYKEKKII
jgi:hypothetical protein